MKKTPYIWSVGGSDPGCGAGVQADVRLIEKMGLLPVTIVTALTVQNFRGVSQLIPVSGQQIEDQIRALKSMMPPMFIKIGLTGSVAAVRVLAREFAGSDYHIICDPVLRAGNGFSLADNEVLREIREHLLPVTSLLTPNIPEAEQLTGIRARTRADIEKMAAVLTDYGAKAVCIKGGHQEGPFKSDYFLSAETSFWMTQRDAGSGAHGTGCLFATSAACFLGMQFETEDAVILANSLVNYCLHHSMDMGPATQKRMQLPEFSFFWDHSPQPFERVNHFPDRRFLPQVSPHLMAEKPFPVLFSPKPGLCPIARNPSEMQMAWNQGIRFGQLRVKSEDKTASKNWIYKAVASARKYSAHLFVNDYWRESVKAEAYGVHLGSGDILLADLDDIQRSGLRLGISTHSLKEALIAARIKPSYFSLGPIFPTTCKAMKFSPQGVWRIYLWKLLFPEIPLVVIGGIRQSMISMLRAHGADGFAVVSDIYHCPDPEERIRNYQITI